MNATFNINRFYNYSQNFAVTNWTKLLINILTFALWPLALITLRITIMQGDGTFPTAALAVLPIMLIFNPFYLEKNIDKNSSTFDFILPASTFEKFLTRFLIYVLILPTLCLTLSTIVIQLYFLIPYQKIVLLKETIDYSMFLDWTTLYIVLALQSFYWVGTYYFKRMSIAVTTVLIIIALFSFSIIFMIFTFFFIKDTFGVNPFDITEEFINNIEIVHDTTPEELYLKSNTFRKLDMFFKYILITIIPLGMWVVSYFKLKETEI